MIEIQQIADVPGRTPSGSSFQRLNHRLSRWLADRAEGVVTAPVSNTVRWIPKSPEEQEAWRQRKARRSSSAGEKPARQYPYRRSAAQAYRQQKITQPQGGGQQRDPGQPECPEPEKGAEAIVVSSPSGPNESDSQASGSKPAAVAPSVRPAHFQRRPRRHQAGRRSKAPRLKPDFSNLDRVILHSLRVLR